jgi:DNA replication protein DnaC
MMIDMYASTWRSEEERKHFHHKMIESQVLLLDDVGKEKKLSVDLPQATFDLVLRSRVQNGRSTIVTSNITSEHELRQYGTPVMSLLREKSISIKVTGGDFRERAHQRELDEIRAGETRPIV